MVPLRNALSRSVGFFGVPPNAAFTRWAAFTVFRRIYTEINASQGRSLQGRTTACPTCFFSSAIRPQDYLHYCYPFPDSETIKDFVSEHTQLVPFQGERLNVAIATLCADRFARRKMNDDTIRKIVTAITSDLANGKDGSTGEEISQFNLTNNKCSTLDRILPQILKECSERHRNEPSDRVADPSNSPDSFRVSGS